MSLGSMIAEQRGVVPGYSSLLSRVHLREAWSDIKNLRGWSFQLCTGGFATPSVINAGAATTQIGNPVVTFDLAASTAIITYGSMYGSLLTQRQFRVGASTIYNIISANMDDPTAVTITLDRPWIDRDAGPSLGYSIYQCYYPTPVKDFEAWEAIEDVINVVWVRCNGTKNEADKVNRRDPQRQIFAPPSAMLPFITDTRVGSSTPGFKLYELYPQPQSRYVYQTWYTRKGPDLVNLSDELPAPMTESLVKARARMKAYEWVMANRGTDNPRGSGGDPKFAYGVAKNEYETQLHDLRLFDRESVDVWQSQMTRLGGYDPVATFDPNTGRASARNL